MLQHKQMVCIADTTPLLTWQMDCIDVVEEGVEAYLPHTVHVSFFGNGFLPVQNLGRMKKIKVASWSSTFHSS